MRIYFENDTIYFSDEKLNRLAQTNYTPELWKIVNSNNWNIKKGPNGKPKYLYSSKLRKYLHQVIIDYYFGEDTRKTAYKNKMVIEHLNNDGLDCKISNLYFLLDIKNKYKGNYLDKFIKKSIPIASLNVYHIIENSTFQITIDFNQFFQNSNGEYIHVLKLLYDCDYCTVLQDAESMLENIVNTMAFSMSDFKQKYRFKDYRISYMNNIPLTDEEKKLPSGSIVFRNGEPYIIQRNDNFGTLYCISSPYDINWN